MLNLYQSVLDYFEDSIVLNKENLDLRLSLGPSIWGIMLCTDDGQAQSYNPQFEAAMKSLIYNRQSASDKKDLNLLLALSFSSTINGSKTSYRRALKKYSNSIIFEDVGIHLLLVEDSAQVRLLAPTEVNSFLRDLDNYIIDRKSRRKN
jgi:hypothetical protein